MYCCQSLSASAGQVVEIRVSVIGGAGKMGEWFVRHFASAGFTTVLSDKRLGEANAVAEAYGAASIHTNREAVTGADLVLVSVPIRAIRDVVLDIAPHMREGAVLAEISSLKLPTVDAMRRASEHGVVPLSIHPLFGPAARTLRGQSVVVVPVVDGEAELKVARRWFGEGEIISSEAQVHDRVMSLVLSLPYMMNMAFAKVLQEDDLCLLKKMSGTTFTVQLALAESVVGEEPQLVESLLKENPFTQPCLDQFLSESKRLRDLLNGSSEEFSEYMGSLVDSLMRDPDYHDADERRYRAFTALKGGPQRQPG